MENAYSEGEGMQLICSPIEVTPSYVYCGRSMNMHNDLDDELNKRSRAAQAAFGPLREAADHLTNPDLHTYLFNTTVLLVRCYADVT